MEVERLTAVLEASGLGTFTANMAAADRATGGTKDQLRALTEISKVATEALKHVKLTAAQAMESKVSAESILQGVKGIGEEARQAARDLDRVHLSEAQAVETRAVAAQQVAALKDVEHQAIKTRAAQGGGGGGGGGGVTRMGLIAAAIGGGVLLGPAAGPGTLGLLAAIPVLASTGAGALGTLMLGFQGVTKAIEGNKKAFDGLEQSQQQFVLTVRSLDGWFDNLKQTAGAAMFPGLTAGLKAALSPGTVSAITQAVTTFGHAIGDAGKMWGQYFGSQQFQSIFGPLMQAGARNFSLMADTALHLFDAIGVLGRAAIPLVGWMVRGVDAASRWADAFTRSKDATGGLSGAMDQAKQSLQLVGNLFAALAKAVYELGAALYPVSKVAVKDLTDAFNYLAGIIERNRKSIQDMVGGALKALKDLLTVLVPLLKAVAEGIQSVTQGIGGWRPAFDIVLTGLLYTKLKAVATAVGLIGGEAATSTSIVSGLATGLAALAAPLLGIVALESKATSLSNSGARAGGANVIQGPDGRWYEQLGHGVTIPISATAAARLLGTPSTSGSSKPFGKAGWQSMNLAAFQVNKGVDMADENAMIPIALKALAAKGYQVQVTSGYRTYAQQAALYARYVKSGFNQKYIAAKPGTSNHETGNAVDVYVNGKPVSMSPGALRILKQYGLVADVPGDAEHLDLKGYGGSNGSVFSPPPPFTSGLGPKPPKPSIIPASVTHLLSLAGTNAANATAVGNTGSTAKRFLENELADLSLAYDQLQAKLADAHGKAKTQLDKAMHGVEDKIIRLLGEIKNAIVITGDALLPDKLKAKLKKLTSQFTADSDYAQVLFGQTADDYRKTLQKDLLGQAAVYDVMLQKLKQQLVGSSGKQKTAIQAEIAKLTSSLAGVQQQILSNLQANVSSLQSKVGTLFGNVTQQFDAALGKLFFQNGMKTALEQQLADMQAQDQLSSLQDSLQQARDQLAQDQLGALAAVQFDAATGLTKNIYSPTAAKQLAADQKAVEAAQRQLDEYNLGIKAAAERAKLDSDYSEQVTTLNKKLANLAESFQNGTGSMQALRDLASQYGIVINTQSIPDFKDLSSASNDLKQAFIDLTNYIGNITGATPKIPTGGGGGGGGSAPAGSPAQILQNLHAQAVAGIIDPATYAYMISGHKLNIPGMASGGIVRAKPGGTIVRLAEAGQDEEVGPVGGRGGGVVVNLNVSALDPNSVEWGPIAQKIQAELLRLQRRNGGTTGIR